MAPEPEELEVECRYCRLPMEKHLGSGGKVRYYRCQSCRRWVSSTYAEVFRADAKFSARERRAEGPFDPMLRPSDSARRQAQPASSAAFDAMKGKLEAWLASVDDRDPYRALGVSPLDSDETVRQRFRELAMQYHPDRGGALDRMRELNLAYERILRHRAARRAERAASIPALPARSR